MISGLQTMPDNGRHVGFLKTRSVETYRKLTLMKLVKEKRGEAYNIPGYTE